MARMTTDTPRVWVGCLGCYNDGRLVGEWVDAIDAGDITPEDIHGHATVCEELWCFDHENFLGLIDGECSPGHAAEVAAVLEDVEEWMREAFAAFLRYYGTHDDLSDTLSAFQDAYAGQWDSEQDFAQELAEDTGAINADARGPNDCIDWERATRELMHDYASEPDGFGGVFIFRTS